MILHIKTLFLIAASDTFLNAIRPSLPLKILQKLGSREVQNEHLQKAQSRHVLVRCGFVGSRESSQGWKAQVQCKGARAPVHT